MINYINGRDIFLESHNDLIDSKAVEYVKMRDVIEWVSSESIQNFYEMSFWIASGISISIDGNVTVLFTCVHDK